MTEANRTDSRRVVTVVATGVIAAALAVAFATFWITQLLTLEGSDRFLMLNTLVAFVVLVWIWVALAIVSLVVARRVAGRPRAILTPALVALGVTALCIVLFVVTLFI
ncbi:hypothetical protein [Agromyces atrinae]|uniref:Uncharacterized protein n=1 Tax=Agromyces atrinae TaxID=592376 RepID=A0A4Q2M402_9MICO|nr:hypothetical protein [Agromyces atrinae]NYD67414.1 hypothetical protein [Agromyces atrinae]RXZ86765.1 hypothetical protein ESP50_06770 [Agromyces atrinae]